MAHIVKDKVHGHGDAPVLGAHLVAEAEAACLKGNVRGKSGFYAPVIDQVIDLELAVLDVKLLPLQIPDGDRAAAAQRVAPVHQQLDGKAFQLGDIVQAALERPNGEGQIAFLFKEEALHLAVRKLPVGEGNIRVVLFKIHEAVRCEEAQDAVGREQIHLASAAALDIFNLLLQAVPGACDACGVLEKGLTALCEMDPALAADEEGRVKLCFHILQDTAQSLGREIQQLGCPCDAFFPADCLKIFQVLYVHRNVNSFSGI